MISGHVEHIYHDYDWYLDKERLSSSIDANIEGWSIKLIGTISERKEASS